MPDRIACFPLRGATSGEISIALAESYAEYAAWQAQAGTIASFVEVARAAGVESVVAERSRSALSWFRAAGILVGDPTASAVEAMVSLSVKEQLYTAEHGVNVAAIVMLHNSTERFVWRLTRFGLVANREKATEWIGNKKVNIRDLVSTSVDEAVDAKLEDWWKELERDSLIEKWDCLVGLVGFPAKLIDPPNWHFDRNMIVQFDETRINAVHYDASYLKTFGLNQFSAQLSRASLIWLVHFAQRLGVKVDANRLWGLKQKTA